MGEIVLGIPQPVGIPEPFTRDQLEVLQGQGAIPVSCPEPLRTAGCRYPPVRLALLIPLLVAILIAYARFHHQTSVVPDWGRLCRLRSSRPFPQYGRSLHKRYWEFVS